MVQPYIVWGGHSGNDDEAYADEQIKHRASCAHLGQCLRSSGSHSSSRDNNMNSTTAKACESVNTTLLVWEVLGSFTVDETFLETSPWEDFPPHGNME
jgi:hypothetical protein